MSSSESHEVKTRARTATGLEFGSFFHRRGGDHFQLSSVFSMESSLSWGGKSTHQSANTSQRPCHRFGDDASLVHSCVTRLDSHPRVRVSLAGNAPCMCLDTQARDRCVPGVNIVPCCCRSARVSRLPLFPHRWRLMTGTVVRGSKSSSPGMDFLNDGAKGKQRWARSPRHDCLKSHRLRSCFFYDLLSSLPTSAQWQEPRPCFMLHSFCARKQQHVKVHPPTPSFESEFHWPTPRAVDVTSRVELCVQNKK